MPGEPKFWGNGADLSLGLACSLSPVYRIWFSSGLSLKAGSDLEPGVALKPKCAGSIGLPDFEFHC